MEIKKFLRSLFIPLIIVSWIFSGWPPIYLPQKDADGGLKFSQIWMVNIAEAASTGPNFPTSGVNDASIGVTVWMNPGNVTASDDVRATVTLAKNSGISQVIKATGFGFAIPADAQIDGITVEWENSENGDAPAGGIKDSAVRIVKAGTIGATDLSNTTFWVAPASEAFVTYGGATNLWGETWIAADINDANFGAAISAKNVKVSGGGANETARVDSVRITISYTLPTYTQSAYRLFNNTDSTDVGTTLAAQDTVATLGSTGAAFRLRMLLHIGTAQLNASVQNFKLQFAEQSGACDTGFVGETYADVTAATAIAYNDNATPADGAALTANANDPTHGADTIVNQTYEELNNFTNSVAAIPATQDGKWDFSLKDNGATASTAYCLRAVKSDGTVLNTYTVIPQITTAAGATVSCSSAGSPSAFGALSAGAISTAAPNVTTTMSCTFAGGCTLNVKDGGNGTNPGLTTTPTYIIGSADSSYGDTATLAAGTEGYGIQAATTSAGSGGVVLVYPRYKQTGNAVGGLELTNQGLASSSVAITDREIAVTHKTAISGLTQAGTYQDVITYSCVGN
jgi:hypothetical protein